MHHAGRSSDVHALYALRNWLGIVTHGLLAADVSGTWCFNKQDQRYFHLLDRQCGPVPAMAASIGRRGPHILHVLSHPTENGKHGCQESDECPDQRAGCCRGGLSLPSSQGWWAI